MRKSLRIIMFLCCFSLSTASQAKPHKIPEGFSLGDLVQSAEAGDKHAQRLIGSNVLLNEKILGETYKNNVQAKKWLNIAIKREPHLARSLGDELKRKHRLVQAQLFYQRAVRSGDKKALYSLGSLYLGSHYSERGNRLAKQYLEAAAASGQTLGYVRIGHMYQNGWGVPKDFRKAEEYFNKAIRAGNTRGFSALAFMKEQNLPNPNYNEILGLYLKDAPTGHPTAIKGVQRLYEEHKKETGLTQKDILFWSYVQRYQMIKSLGYPEKILEDKTKYHNGLRKIQIYEIQEKAEALVKSFSEKLSQEFTGVPQ